MCTSTEISYECGHRLYKTTYCKLYRDPANGILTAETCDNYEGYEQIARGICKKYGACLRPPNGLNRPENAGYDYARLYAFIGRPWPPKPPHGGYGFGDGYYRR